MKFWSERDQQGYRILIVLRECSIVERYSTCSALYLVDFTRGIICLSLHFLTLSMPLSTWRRELK
jgi:hypothetical protein